METEFDHPLHGAEEGSLGQLTNILDDDKTEQNPTPAGGSKDSTMMVEDIKKRHSNEDTLSLLKRSRGEESADCADVVNAQDDVGAAVIANRSERKRSREKRRRSDLNVGLDSLATLLYTIDPKLKSPLGASKKSSAHDAEAQSAISNRVELVNFAVKLMTRLHEENEARKIVISDLTGRAGYRDLHQLPGRGPRYDAAISSVTSMRAFTGDGRRLASDTLQGKTNLNRRVLGAEPASHLLASSVPGSFTSSSAHILPRGRNALDSALYQQPRINMVEAEQLRSLETLQQERQYSAEQTNLPASQQSLQLLHEQSFASHLSTLRHRRTAPTVLSPDTMDAFAMMQARGGLHAGLASNSLLSSSSLLMSARHGGAGAGGQPGHLSSAFAINQLLTSGWSPYHTVSQRLLQHQRDAGGSILPSGVPTEEMDLTRSILKAQGAAAASHDAQPAGSTQLAPTWDPSAALFQASRGRGRRGRPPPPS